MITWKNAAPGTDAIDDWDVDKVNFGFEAQQLTLLYEHRGQS